MNDSVDGDLVPATPQFIKEAYMKAAELVAGDEVDLGYLPRLGKKGFGEDCAKIILGDSK